MLKHDQIEKHLAAEKLLTETDFLGAIEREQVLRDWQPTLYDTAQSKSAITSFELAEQFCQYTLTNVDKPRAVVDLCAGIGALSLVSWLKRKQQFPKIVDKDRYVCVENNPEYAKVGKRLFPEATWIIAPLHETAVYLAGQHFDEFYAYPPPGHIDISVPTQISLSAKYRWEYMVATLGLYFASRGTMIVSDLTALGKYSSSDNSYVGRDYLTWKEKSHVNFHRHYEIDLSIGHSSRVEPTCLNIVSATRAQLDFEL